jgi:hypothetical protein
MKGGRKRLFKMKRLTVLWKKLWAWAGNVIDEENDNGNIFDSEIRTRHIRQRWNNAIGNVRLNQELTWFLEILTFVLADNKHRLFTATLNPAVAICCVTGTKFRPDHTYMQWSPVHWSEVTLAAEYYSLVFIYGVLLRRQ